MAACGIVDSTMFNYKYINEVGRILLKIGHMGGARVEGFFG